jgi:serine/threonine protein kinase
VPHSIAIYHEEEEIVSFLKEGLIMKEFEHCNVLKLKGICFGDDNLPLVLMPFMEKGDLLSFIRDKKNVLMTDDKLIFTLGIAKGKKLYFKLKNSEFEN